MNGEEKRGILTERITPLERFCGFATYHFGVSALISCVMLSGFFVILPPILDVVAGSRAGSLLTALSMLLIYIPLGMAAAGNREWIMPQTTKEKVLAVTQPTAVAWLWVGLVLLLMTLDGDAALNGLFIVFILSVLLAAPSSLFVLVSIEWWGYGTRLERIPALALIGAMAGFLPPLFFAWGSFWQSARMERKRMKKAADGL